MTYETQESKGKKYRIVLRIGQLVETGIKSYLNIRIMVDTAQYDKRQIIENNNKNDHRLVHYKFVSYFEWMFNP